MKKKITFLMLLFMVFTFSMSTLMAQERGNIFEQRQKEKMENDKLRQVLDATTNKKEIKLGIKSSCAGDKDLASETVDVKLADDEVLALYFNGIPSAGYKWVMESGFDGALNLAADKMEPAEMPGQFTNWRYVFTSKNKGVTNLRFVYHRPWEDKAPMKEYIINVTSEGDYQGEFLFIDEPPNPVIKKVEETTNKALPSSFDWRSQGKVTSVKDQGNSNACWAFGTCASTESAILIAGGASRNLSEQYLCNCDPNSSCTQGGWFCHWLFKDNGRGAVYESDVPFYGSDYGCGSYTYHEKITSWGWTDGISDYGWPQQYHYASTTQIKEAIYNHGPVGASCYSSCWYNTSAIQDVDCTGGAHIVTIVGWNDANGGYWIVKNSWGTGWGDNGYLYLRYGRSDMGTYSVWVDAEGGTGTTCGLPTNLSASSITNNSAYLDWSPPSSYHTGYEIAYRQSGVTNWTYQSTSTSYYNLSGLSANTTYEWGVKTICSSSSESDWTTMETFQTTDGIDDGGPLSDGVTANGTISSSGDTDMWYIDVGSNATSMRVVLECGSNDFDTYGKFTSQPTTSSYDWRGYTSGGEDNTVNNPQAGRHYILVNPYSGTGTYTLKATVTYDNTPPPTDYCSAQSNSTSYEYISRVRFGSIDQSSGSNGYDDFTSVSTNLSTGSTTNLSITTAGNYSSDELVVYIDFNGDGDFTGSGEEVYHNTNAGSATTYSTSVAVPTNAQSGSTRMRIILFDVTYDNKQPCGTFDYGEVEDYTVNIGGAGSIEENIIIESIEQNTFTIYPNPVTKGQFVLESTLNNYNMKLLDLSGRTIMTKACTNNVEQINVDGITGIYLIIVESGEEKFTKKIVIE